MPHVMVDIETLDTVQSAVVLSIGAVVFDPFSNELGEKFYMEFVDDLSDQQKRGRTISGDTVRWWMQQGAAAKQIFADPAPHGVTRVTTSVGLAEFSHFMARSGGKEVQLWGNGADFDNVIIGSLYDAYEMRKPWSFGKNRCYRTLKRVFGEGVSLSREGVHHNGLDDAVTQATHLQEIMKCIKPQ